MFVICLIIFFLNMAWLSRLTVVNYGGLNLAAGGTDDLPPAWLVKGVIYCSLTLKKVNSYHASAMF